MDSKEYAHNKATILIVDDDLINIEVIFNLLELHGYRAYTINESVKALSEAEKVIPDLILIDAILPGLDGFELCRELKKNTITCDIPVIFMSEVIETFDKIKAFEVGCVDYIIKPFIEQELLSRVQAQIKLSFSRKNLEEKVKERTNALVHEIEDKKEVEHSLAQAKKDWVSAFDSIPDMITINDGECNILAANINAQFLLKAKGAVATKGYNVFHNNNKPPEPSIVNKTDISLQNSVNEFYVKSDDKYYEVREIPRFDTNGEIINIIQIVRDVTEKKVNEQNLINSETQFRQIFENSRDGMVIFRDNTIVLVNPEYCVLFGYTSEEIINKPLSDMITSNNETNFQIKEHNKISVKSVPKSYESIGLKKDGTFFSIEITPSQYMLDNVIYELYIIRDITERKKLESEKIEREKSLLQSQKLASLSSLSSAIAHEIRQPLLLIKMVVDTIILRFNKKDELDLFDKKNFKNLKVLSSGVERINSIISNMQRLFKFTNEKCILIDQSLNEVIDNVASAYQEKLINCSISLQLSLDSTIPLIKGNEVLLIQVISNILDNSIDSLIHIDKPDKKICISTTFSSNKIELLIGDNGVEISSESIKKVFDPLYTTKSNNQNIGIGLFLVYNIVKSLNGSVEAINNDMNGTTFKIVFEIQ